jgi:endogenous inhibitor of DNA gyrase (YacG/DUF329 family)
MSAKPTIRERASQAICPECGGAVVRRSARGPFPTFCSGECKRVRANRRLVRGSAVIEFVQAWRLARGSGEIAKASFAQICAIADQFNAEDNAAGRPRADLAASKLIISGTLFCDRQHVKNHRDAKRRIGE